MKNSEAMQTAQTALEHCGYRARTSWYDEWSQLVYTICEPCLYEEISCEDALAELESQTKEIISKYESNPQMKACQNKLLACWQALLWR
ncbi:MAG: hypothetical protein ACLU9T_15835 [Blautia faecis]